MASHIECSAASSTRPPLESAIPAIPHISFTRLPASLRLDLDPVVSEPHWNRIRREGARRHRRTQAGASFQLCNPPELEADRHEDKEKDVQLRPVSVSGARIRLKQRERQGQAEHEGTHSKGLAQSILYYEPIAFEHHRHQQPPRHQLRKRYELSEIRNHPWKRREQNVQYAKWKKADGRLGISDVDITTVAAVGSLCVPFPRSLHLFNVQRLLRCFPRAEVTEGQADDHHHYPALHHSHEIELAFRCEQQRSCYRGKHYVRHVVPQGVKADQRDQ